MVYDFRKQRAGRVELRIHDVRGVGQNIAAYQQGRSYFFQGGVSGAFADTIDSYFDLTRSTFDAGQRIGDRKAKIVVAVCGEDDAFHARQLSQHAEDGCVFRRCHIADGIRNIDGGGPGLHGNLDHLAEESGFGACRVHGRELYVVHKGAGPAYRFGGEVECLCPGHPHLVLEMDVGGGEKGMDAVVLSGFHGTSG